MKNSSVYLLTALLLLSATGCRQNKKITNPTGYDLGKPIVYKMTPELDEISGITFKNNNPDTIFSEQDEAGKIFFFKLGDEALRDSKVAKNGDYEDIAACRNYMILLRSDGVLFTMAAAELYNKVSSAAQEQKNLLPAGEYEAMYADETAGLLYVLCKQCSGDKESGTVLGYRLQLSDNGKLAQKDKFFVDEKKVAALAGAKPAFKPSAISKHPSTGEWYILSSVNKLLLVTDAGLKPLNAYPLDAAIFTQPEGMTFDSSGNLYISNEKGNGSTGTILKFTYAGGKQTTKPN